MASAPGTADRAPLSGASPAVSAAIASRPAQLAMATPAAPVAIQASHWRRLS